jgi:hypothetical protein
MGNSLRKPALHRETNHGQANTAAIGKQQDMKPQKRLGRPAFFEQVTHSDSKIDESFAVGQGL